MVAVSSGISFSEREVRGTEDSYGQAVIKR